MNYDGEDLFNNRVGDVTISGNLVVSGGIDVTDPIVGAIEQPYTTFVNQASPPVVPDAGKLKLYSDTSDVLHSLDSTGADTVIAKTIEPFRTYTNQATAPANPSAGNLVLYTDTSNSIHALDSTGGDVVIGGASFTANDITALNTGGATYNTVQDLQNIFHSSGHTTGGVITDNLDGTINVSAGEGFLRDANNSLADCYFIAFPAVTNVVLTDDALNYVKVDWNGGTPAIVVNDTEPNHNTDYEVGTIYKSTGSNDIHITGAAVHEVADHANLMIERLKDLMYISRKSGSNISEVGTRNIAITEGLYWIGLSRFIIPSINTSVADTFIYYYNPASYVAVPGQTQIDNTQYDNAGTLTTLGNNQYGVHWVYTGSDGDTYIIYGTSSYTLTDAENSFAPTVLPAHFTKHAVLLGRIIIQRDATTFTRIESAFASVFTGASAGINVVNGIGTDDALVRFDADGNTIQNSDAILDDTGKLTLNELETIGNITVGGTVDGVDIGLLNTTVTDLGTNKLDLAGGTMTGVLDMGANNIITTGLVDGVDVSHIIEQAPTDIPDGPMTNDTTVLASGTFITTASSTWDNNLGIFHPFQIFDDVVDGDGWASAQNSYLDGIHNAATSTTVSGVPRDGEWVQIQFPSSKVIERYELLQRNKYDATQGPVTWTLAGSNDDVVWTLIDRVVAQPIWSAGELRSFDVSIGDQSSYLYVRLITEEMESGTSSVLLGELYLFDNQYNISNIKNLSMNGVLNINGVDTVPINKIGIDSLVAGVGAKTSGDTSIAIGNTSQAVNTGANNTTVGHKTVLHSISATDITAVGHEALIGIVGVPLTGTGNTAVGSYAMTQCQGVGAKNTALGHQSAPSITTGLNNTIIGANANATATGSNQTSLGYQADCDTSNQITLGNADVDSIVNTGDNVCDLGSTGRKFKDLYLGGNIIVGGTVDGVDISTLSAGAGDVVGPASSTDNAVARFDTTTGKLIQNSVVLISDTGVININGIDTEPFRKVATDTLVAGVTGKTTGVDCIAIGNLSQNVGTGTQNVSIGVSALQNMTSTDNCVAVGHESGLACTSGLQNTFIGARAGNEVDTGGYNTFIGLFSGSNASPGVGITSGSFNTMIGRQTTGVRTGTNQTSLGNFAICNASNQMTLGNASLAEISNMGNGVCNLGSSARQFKDLHLGGVIKIDGVDTEPFRRYVTDTLVVGATGKTTGTACIAIGDLSQNASIAINNVSIGVSSMQYASSAGNSVAVGYLALQGVNGIPCTGTGNCAVGVGGLSECQGGAFNNTACGSFAGNTITTGTANTFIGADSDGAALSSNQTAIGYQATCDAANRVTIGNGSVGSIVNTGNGVCDLGATNHKFRDLHLSRDLIVAEGLTYNQPIGNFYWINNTTLTTITTADTYVEVNRTSATANAGNNAFTLSGTARLNYDGPDARLLSVTASFTFKPSSAAVQLYKFALSRNTVGNVITSSTSTVSTTDAGGPAGFYRVTISDIVSVDNGDVIILVVKNEVNTIDVLIVDCNVSAYGLGR